MSDILGKINVFDLLHYCSNIWYVKNFSDVNAIMENEILPSLSDKFYVIDSNIILLEIEIYTKQKHSFHLFDV